jgi:hypothetical protein
MCNTIDLSSKGTETLVDSSLTPQVRKVSMKSKYNPVTSCKIVVIARALYACVVSNTCFTVKEET